MRVFNINKAIGLASSGVEYAQVYRRELFAGIPAVDDYYVFTDYIPTNLSVFTDRLGFRRDQVLWIYDLVAGRTTRPSTLTVDDYLARVGQPHEVAPAIPEYTDVALTGSPVRYRIRTVIGAIVDRVETIVGDRIVRIEHYDETLHDIEYFHDGRLVRRVFYTDDGRVAAEQFYRNDEILRTLITSASPLYTQRLRAGRERPVTFGGDLVLEGRAQFFQLVFAQLFSRPDDVVIVDRALDVIDGIYPVIGAHRLYSIVHAEHFDPRQLEDGVLLWNNHYEFVFTRPDLVDGFIVSTHRQQEVLEAQLAERMPEGSFSVARIPVGFVAAPASSPEYERFALVTASRLADEKHLDVLVRAVAAARATLPELRLDIYGEGNREPLLAVIEETKSQEFIRLMGHQKLEGLLGPYGLYVSASTSEGFGLSMLEAIAEGLPIVGLDVDYGNREMVESGVNGRLAPHTNAEGDAAALADAIVEVLTDAPLDELRAASLRKAEEFTAAQVRQLWEDLLFGGAPC
ncbi:accessory Sec system glycosyltransferase GtfA [Gryllotalpicola daejeonensis]|uniref:Accessory Sec system glycosyltransferase GtfA n=1 Tax=Gryllotalpicola daejeonensis TaxID=993087 RepID=A0ABP7ZFX7_9MICO